MKKHLLTLIAFLGLSSVGFGQLAVLDSSGARINKGDTVVINGIAGTVSSPIEITRNFYIYDSSLAMNCQVLCLPQPDSVAGCSYGVCVGVTCYPNQYVGNKYLTGSFKAPAGKDTANPYSVHYNSSAPGTTIIRFDLRNTLKTDSTWMYVEFIAKPTGIVPVVNNMHVSSMFPNPANSIASFTYHSDYDAQLSIYNSLGQSVKTMTVSATKETVSINVSDMPSGIYICKLQSAGAETAFRKLIVSH